MTTQTTKQMTTEQQTAIINAGHSYGFGAMSAMAIKLNLNILDTAIDMVEFVETYNERQSIHARFVPITITFNTFDHNDEKCFAVEIHDANNGSSFLNAWLKRYPVDSHFNMYRMGDHIEINCYYNA